MKIYAYTVSDVSPNACRSSFNPDSVFLSKRPCRTNGNPRNIVETGWLGTTNDSDAHATGSIDVELDEIDDDDLRIELESILPDEAKIDPAAVRAWMESDDEDDMEIATTEGDECGSDGMTWSETDESSFFPDVRDGWQFAATHDSNDTDVVHLTKSDASELESLVSAPNCAEAVSLVLDAAGIANDYQSHDTYDSSTCGTDWAAVAVRDSDEDACDLALDTAVALAKLGHNWSTIQRMLAACFARVAAAAK